LPIHWEKLPKAAIVQANDSIFLTMIEVPRNEEEWSMENTAADSIVSSPEELARVSLMQCCLAMAEDGEICDRSPQIIGPQSGCN